jgi:hypothetical protein
VETRLAFFYGAPGTEPRLKVHPRPVDGHQGMVRKRGCLILLVVVAVVSGSASGLRASFLRAMSLGELTNAADKIVVGTVSSANAAWDVQHRKIISTIEIEIEETWKGPPSASRRITIVQPGGSVGDIEMTVLGLPTFSAGEKSVLFLQGRLRFQVVGMGQGKRALVWDGSGKQWLAEPPDTEGVVEPAPGAKLRQAKRGRSIPLSDLREQVLRAIGNSP